MTTAQFVETPVTVNNNSPIQDYVHPDDQTQPLETHCYMYTIGSVHTRTIMLYSACGGEFSNLHVSLIFFTMLFSKAEADLRVCQAEFDRQYEVTKLLLDGISTAHVSTVDFFLGGT